MIDYKNITAVVEQLKRYYGPLSADKLCEALNIEIKIWRPSKPSEAFPALVLKNSRCYTMSLNDYLTAPTKRIVKYHEAGHVALKHFDRMGVYLFDESDMYAASQTEIEANCFAAEYLMNTDDTMELVHEGKTLDNIANELNVSPEIVDFKFRMLKYYQLIDKNYVARYGSDCMGKINCGKNYEDYYD